MEFEDILESSFLEISKKEIMRTQDNARKLNPYKSDNKLFGEKFWDISEFEEEHLPVIVGELKNKSLFSKDNGIRVLDMPLRMPDQGWKIPQEFRQFKELFYKIVKHEKVSNPIYDECYAYITIDQKPVPPMKSQRRPGWHSDAFIVDETGAQVDVTAENRDVIKKQERNRRRIDYTYIAYDKFPTLFLPGPFPLDKCDTSDCEAVLRTFDDIAEGKKPITYPTYTILRLDPYVIHAAAPNDQNETSPRTFIKMAFSPFKYNRKGNTRSPFFDYRWNMIPRETEKRNHRHK